MADSDWSAALAGWLAFRLRLPRFFGVTRQFWTAGAGAQRERPGAAGGRGPGFASASVMAKLQTVLLDVDGTLVDSNDLHAEAWLEALGEQGFQLDFAQVRP